jgi:phage terminase small subunit
MGGKGSGRKPQPLALKVFRGGRIKNMRTPAELAVDAIQTMPEPPPYLGEQGREVWLTDGTALVSIGVITDADVSDFGLVCWAWERVLQLMKESEGPSTIMNDKGDSKTSPALAELRRWLPLLRSMRSDYGLSGPRSRMMSTTEQQLTDAVDPLEAFKRQFG